MSLLFHSGLNNNVAAKKTKAAATVAEPDENAGDNCVASRTRQRKGVICKSQISGPLELQDSSTVEVLSLF